LTPLQLHFSNTFTVGGHSYQCNDESVQVDSRGARGRAVQEQIIGADRVERVHASAAEDGSRFQRFLSANCFGD
jgi:hypothetical protein